MNSRLDGLTLAICTHNGKERLAKTLAHIVQQEIPTTVSWELLVIDNASTDGTSKFVLSEWPDNKRNHLRIIKEETLGAIHARKRAIKEARFNYLSFVDDDNWICSNWVTDVYKIFIDNSSVAIIGSTGMEEQDTKKPYYFSYIKGWMAIGDQWNEEVIITKRPVSFWTAGCSFKVSAIEQIERAGFNPVLVGRQGNRLTAGEDHELCLALTLAGFDIYFSKKLHFTHAISQDRLKEHNVNKLLFQSTLCYPILDIYRGYYKYNKMPSIYYLFVRAFVNYLSSTIKYSIKKLLLGQEGMTPNKISYIIAKGRLMGFFVYRYDSYSKVRNNIKLLCAFEKINQNNAHIESHQIL